MTSISITKLLEKYQTENEQQAERIRELEAENDKLEQLWVIRNASCEALAAQNEKLREALNKLTSDTTSHYDRLEIIRTALALPDHSAHVLDMVRAKTLEEAADEFGRRWTQASKVQEELRKMAQEKRKEKS